MYIIAGLGNPTSEYAGTRHNVGFDAVDALAKQMGVSIEIKKHNALCGMGLVGGQKVLLMKPQTFMNLSGQAIRAAVDFYKLDPEEELIVLYDDISLDVGKLRIRGKGSAGGHNGIKSIISCLGTEKFKRIKIGVGEKKGSDLVKHVLGRFPKEERQIVDEAISQAALAVPVMILKGIDTAMNKYNH